MDDRVITGIRHLCDTATQGHQLAQDLSERLSEAVAADAFCFLQLDPVTSLWRHATHRRYPPGFCEAYVHRAFMQTAAADPGRMAREGRYVARSCELADSAEDPYVSGLLGQSNFTDELQAVFTVGQQAYGHLALARLPSAGAFTEEHKRLIEAVRGPIARALRRLHHASLVQAAPADGTALFIHGHLGVEAANTLAEQLLDHFRAAGFDRPTDAMSGFAAHLKRQRQLSRPDLVQPMVIIDPVTGERYRLQSETIRLPGHPADSVGLIMAEPLRALDSLLLLQQCGLTPREADVCLAAVRGWKNADGASALGMSEQTYLTHLKKVHGKLGVQSRSELAALILGGT